MCNLSQGIREDGIEMDVTRLISARYATNFESGLCYGKYQQYAVRCRDDLAFTKEELEELKRAREMPIVFDEDCPETILERAMRFRRVNPPRGTDARRA